MSEMNGEKTVIGTSTVIEGPESSVTCGGDLTIRGVINGVVEVGGRTDLYGTINGDLEANEVIVESNGKINGNTVCKTNFVLNENSRVAGNIKTKSASICASVEGNVDVTNEIEIASTGKVIGNIAASSLVVASGAVIQGNVAIKKK